MYKNILVVMFTAVTLFNYQHLCASDNDAAATLVANALKQRNVEGLGDALAEFLRVGLKKGGMGGIAFKFPGAAGVSAGAASCASDVPADGSSAAPVVTKKCSRCEGSKPKMFRCGSCKGVIYCGVECQKADWAKHRHACEVKSGSTK